jgi:hypothetical protein
VRLEGDKAKIKHLFVQYKIVKHVVQEDVEQRIATAAGSIMVGLQGHKPPEQGVENIQYGKNGLSHLVVNLTHRKRIYCPTRIHLLPNSLKHSRTTLVLTHPKRKKNESGCHHQRSCS